MRAALGPTCSGEQVDAAKPLEGGGEQRRPRPSGGQVQRGAPSRTGHTTGDREVATAEGVGGDQLASEPEARAEPGEVVGDHVEGEPGGVRAEAARGEVVETDAVFEVADDVFDLGVSAVVGFERERVAQAIGDEG